MIFSSCPCDGAAIAAPVNLPELSRIAFRIGDYAAFRRAVLTPLPGEQSLAPDGAPRWRPGGAGDLAMMIAEWFAYLADILTFYNERIANQDYLRTADLPESVAHLIALLGYRPRPAIGATGTLAALLGAGQVTVLPQGLQFQSKPTPGHPPQTFELAADTPIGLPDQIPATPAPVLLAHVTAVSAWSYQSYHASNRFSPGWYSPPIVQTGPVEAGHYRLLLRGAVETIDPGALLMLRPRDPALGAPLLATVLTAAIGPTSTGGGQQTILTLALSATPPDGMAAAQVSLERTNQSAGLWSLFGGAISGRTLHLASLVRQIRPGDHVLLTATGHAPLLLQISATSETIWDATGTSTHPTKPASANHPVPILHTVLTLTTTLSAAWNNAAANATLHFAWVSAGHLLNRPFAAWSGTPATLLASSAKTFPPLSDLPILLQDANGAGIAATGNAGGAATDLLLGSLPTPVPPLQPPFLVLPNLLPVTRGKTVVREVLGSGDPTRPNQSFSLAQSPVTYLQKGATWASTIALTVNGQPWTEVKNFYGQAADASVFVTSEDDAGQTHVAFGDGVNGARLPAGRNNVVASYRVGAGAAFPPAGKLTIIAQSWPGLRAVLNPLAVGGGADADPPAQIRRYAPRSVLAFGRAVGVFDYAALAAQAPGVTRARAVWAWNDASQRALVTVYVGDDAAAAASAKSVLVAAGDPNRPVRVVLATRRPVALDLALRITPGMDADAIAAGIVTALTDTETGLFGAWQQPIGQPLFDSRIEAAILAVPGTVAITARKFTAGTASPGPLHNPGEAGYFTLDPADISLTTEPDSHGG